jgi:hypothetical protein
MSWLTSWLHPDRGYKDANDVLTNSYNEGKGFQQPYNQNGQNQYANLQEYINNLMHPEKLQDEWIKNYHESEAAKNAETAAQEHGLNAAGASGLGGSNSAINAIQKGTSRIGNEDRQQYLNDLMEKYKVGAGLSSGIYGVGASTANNMATNANNFGQNSAGLKFGETNAPGEMFGKIGGAGIKLLMDYLTGGFGGGGWSTGGR